MLLICFFAFEKPFAGPDPRPSLWAFRIVNKLPVSPLFFHISIVCQPSLTRFPMIEFLDSSFVLHPLSTVSFRVCIRPSLAAATFSRRLYTFLWSKVSLISSFYICFFCCSNYLLFPYLPAPAWSDPSFFLVPFLLHGRTPPLIRGHRCD